MAQENDMTLKGAFFWKMPEVALGGWYFLGLKDF